jgi:cell division protein FtsB
MLNKEAEMIRRLAFLVSLVLVASLAAAQQPAQERPKQPPKKVWTNEDLEALRGRVRISSFEGAAPPAAAAAPAEEAAPAGPAGQVYNREDDPAWYRQRLTALRAEVERIDAEISRLRDVRSRGTQSEVAVGFDTPRTLSPEDQIAALERRRSQLEQQISDIEDEARRRGIAPSTLR